MNESSASRRVKHWERSDLIRLRDTYRGGLLEDTVPFWAKHALDPQHGGYFTCLGRAGELLQNDKSVWFQGRMAWMFSSLCLNVEARPEWLEHAKSGIEFLNKHCFDSDGRMFFSVTREGQPLRKRRYLFSECFAIIALAAYGKAAGKPEYLEQAQRLFSQVLHYHKTPGLLEPKTNPSVRPTKGLAMPMILMVTAQELRKYADMPECNVTINECIHEIGHHFLNQEFRCVLECVGPNGEFLDNFDGRCVNPGHSLEAGWFILEESRQRGGDAELVSLGRKIIDWSLEIGWDREYGGVLYFRDAKNLPCTEYWHDMKFWWPHNEALIATLMAYQATGDAGYAEWHDRIFDWTYAHFPDREHGEWYGYLHRDGSVSTPVKGTMYKGFFHIPRMQMVCWQLLDEMLQS